TQGSQDAGDDIADRRAPGNRRFTLWEVAQDDASDGLEFAGLPEMHQCAVHLPGLHTPIFENKNGVTGIEFPRSAESSLDKSQAPPEDSSSRSTSCECFALQANQPTAARRLKRRHQGRLIVTVGSAGSRVKA